MENVSVLNYPGILNDSFYLTSFNRETITRKNTGFSPTIIKVIAEGGENFFLYLKRIGFSKEDNLLALSSVHHYFYDENELMNVATLVNLKKLNHIKDLDGFLQTLLHMLPRNSNFVGCFSNDKTHRQNGLTLFKPSRLFNRFINFIDSKPDRILDKNTVTEALEKNGHKIVDMTEIDGLIYFCSKLSLDQSN